MNEDVTNKQSVPVNFRNHPLLGDVNKEHQESLSPVEKGCKKVADGTGSPYALIAAVIIQIIWIAVGTATKSDPYPYVFLLTCSNVIQLILIFVLAVAQRQSSAHAELRAQHDHDAIARLLHHQEVQESILLALAQKIEVDVEALRATVQQLAEQDA